MQIAARTGAWSGKPLPYLRRVAYLESHRTEWIDTGVIPNSNIGFELTGCFVSKVSSGDEQILGARGGGYYEIDITGNNSVFWQYATRSNLLTPVSFSEKVTYTNRFGNLVCGEKNVDFSQYSLSGTRPVFLFAMNNNGTADRKSASRIYECRFFGRDENDIAKFVPVLDLSGRPAMYDLVSGQFYYNQGTGEFTWGELGEE